MKMIRYAFLLIPTIPILINAQSLAVEPWDVVIIEEDYGR